MLTLLIAAYMTCVLYNSLAFSYFSPPLLLLYLYLRRVSPTGIISYLLLLGDILILDRWKEYAKFYFKIVYIIVKSL